MAVSLAMPGYGQLALTIVADTVYGAERSTGAG